jgi:hypothetical protein
MGKVVAELKGIWTEIEIQESWRWGNGRIFKGSPNVVEPKNFPPETAPQKKLTIKMLVFFGCLPYP